MAPGDKKPSCGPFIVQLSEVCVTGRRRAFSFKRVLLCAFVHTHDFLAYMFSVFYCCSSCPRIVKTVSQKCLKVVSSITLLQYLHGTTAILLSLVPAETVSFAL